MLWRKLNRVFCRKGKILTVIMVIFWGIAGIFLQYQLYCMEASYLKWAPLERMGTDWYYYMSYKPKGEEDLKMQAIEESCHALGMSLIRTSGNDSIDVYQYSEEAWKQFAYPLDEGDGFSLDPNEMIVSPELAKDFPVGSKIRMTCSPKVKTRFSTEKTEFICTVVGVLAQEEIFFRYWEKDRDPEIQGSASAMFSGSQFVRAFLQGGPRFAVVNPLMSIGPNCSEETAGIFFQAERNIVSEINLLYREEGEIVPVSQVIEEFNEYGHGIEGLGEFRISLILAFWVGAILCTVCWQRYVLKESVEELSYLIYIKYDETVVWRRFLRASFSRYIWAWLISCLAYFLPNDYEGFWKMHWYIPAVSLGISVVAGALSRWISYMHLKARYRSGTQQYLGETELVNYLHIPDLSVADNLLLIMVAQNYPERMGTRMVDAFLTEREISYRNRRMSYLDMQRKFEFYEMRDELLKE